MAILTGSDRFTLFSAQPITTSLQVSDTAQCGGVAQVQVELTAAGNTGAVTFFIEGSNDGAATWLPAETVADVAGATKSGNDIPATIYRLTHVLAAGVTAMSWTFPQAFTDLRLSFTGASAAGTLTVKLQLVRGNG